MPRTALKASLAVALVVLAGCTGFGLQGGATPTDAADGPTPTDAATPTVTPTPSGDGLPPGLSADGLTSAWDLASAHAAALDERSFTVREVASIHRTDGSHTRRHVQTVRVGDDQGVYRFESTVREDDADEVYPSTPPEARQAYANGSVVVERTVTREGNTSVALATTEGGPTAPVRYPHATPRNRDRAFYVLSVVETSVAGTENGTVTLEGTGVTDDVLVLDGTRISNVSLESFSATVTADGVVSAYRLEVTGTVDGHRVRAVESVEYEETGATAPEKPSWWSEAFEA